MPDRCLRSLQVVYEKASELFQKVEALLSRYRPYMILGLYEGALSPSLTLTPTATPNPNPNPYPYPYPYR